MSDAWTKPPFFSLGYAANGCGKHLGGFVFGDVASRAALKHAEDILAVVMGTQCEDVGLNFKFKQALSHLVAAQFRQVDIEDDDIGLF